MGETETPRERETPQRHLGENYSSPAHLSCPFWSRLLSMSLSCSLNYWQPLPTRGFFRALRYLMAHPHSARCCQVRPRSLLPSLACCDSKGGLEAPRSWSLLPGSPHGCSGAVPPAGFRTNLRTTLLGQEALRYPHMKFGSQDEEGHPHEPGELGAFP